MNAFFLKGFHEYKQQIDSKKIFESHTDKLGSIIKSLDFNDFTAISGNVSKVRQRSLIFLIPIVEVAWADGRVTRREMDSIVHIAEAYGLIDDQKGYQELMNQLLSRPINSFLGRVWQSFRTIFEQLDDAKREEVINCLNIQTQYVAEQSSNNIISFLRGERVSKDEEEVLANIRKQLKNADLAAQDVSGKTKVSKINSPQTIESDGLANKKPEFTDDYSKLIPMIPLVKTAWAEGRVTKREKQIVFEAANRFGIKSDSSAYQRLSEWLELHPTDEFYDSAFDDLHQQWQTLNAEEKNRRRFDLLHECTRIAEASGGSKQFPAGGVRICEEEIAVVKNIAQRLNLAA